MNEHVHMFKSEFENEIWFQISFKTWKNLFPLVFELKYEMFNLNLEIEKNQFKSFFIFR
jgi:hypothetical protein